MSATITVLTGRNAGAVFDLKAPVTDIGRGSDADISLTDAGLSRRHARIQGAGDRYSIEDLGSTNGTFINGAKVTERVSLESGAKIQIGDATVLRFALLDQVEQEAAKRMYEMTVRDPLTSLHNRRHLDERFAEEFAFATRHKTSLTAFVIDIDHFKLVNDTHGHPAGDAVLRATAAALQRMVRTEDVLVRFGGEEFVVLARGIDDRGTEVFAERLRAGIENMRVPWEGGDLRLTVSVGVAHFSGARDYPTAKAMLAAADAALYVAKNAGRNRVALAGDG
jgi:diguanylate cyclase (GGDEF)-like protein